MRIGIARIAGLVIALAAAGLMAQAPAQPEQDAYTRIELAAPDTGSFKVIHEAAAITTGAREHAFHPWPCSAPPNARA